MAKTVAKNFRFDAQTCRLLQAIVEQTGSNSSRVAELAISCYALEIGVEISRAREFLFNNLLERVAANRRHKVSHSVSPVAPLKS